MTGAARAGARRAGVVVAALLMAAVALVLGASGASGASAASAATSSSARTAVTISAATRLAPADPAGPSGPVTPKEPAQPDDGTTDVTLSVPGEPSRVVQIIVLITVIGVAPAILLMMTSFTKIVVVLSLTRSAIGTPTIPPNQVLVGLALFLSLFVMGPTLDKMNDVGVKPYMDGRLTSSQAIKAAEVPLKDFMLKHTRDEELALMTKAAGQQLPKSRQDVELRTLVPAFVLSELRGAFIIGFVIFVPFLVVDIVVSAILMSLGMVMLPPSLISLPFKLLLFVLVDGWSLIVTTLLGTYR